MKARNVVEWMVVVGCLIGLTTVTGRHRGEVIPKLEIEQTATYALPQGWGLSPIIHHLRGEDSHRSPAVCDDVEVVVALLDMTRQTADAGTPIAIEKIELAVEKIERGFARQLDTLVNLEPQSRNWALTFEVTPPKAVVCPVGMTVRLLNASGEPVETSITIVNNHFSSRFGSTP